MQGIVNFVSPSPSQSPPDPALVARGRAHAHAPAPLPLPPTTTTQQALLLHPAATQPLPFRTAAQPPAAAAAPALQAPRAGFSGQSKACNTCRKRKKGCDQQRPACSQCRKACIPCGGYSREWKFRNATIQPVSNSRSSNSPPASATSSTMTVTTRATTTTPSPIRVRPGSAVVQPDSLTLSAYSLKYSDLFWSEYLPNGQSIPLDAVGNMPDGLSAAVLDHGSNHLVKKATLAISLSTIGRRDNHQWMKEDGIRLYSEALQNLAMALKESAGDGLNAGLLATIRLFSLYESLFGLEEGSPQISTWLVHKMGDATFIKSKSPHAFAVGHAHWMFVEQRMHLCITAIRTRKQSFAATPEWKTQPWTVHKKTSRDLVLDVFIDCPAILEGMDEANAATDPEERERILARLRLRYQQISDDLEACEAQIRPGLQLRENVQPTDIITTTELAATHVISLYWTACIVLHGMCGRELFAADVMNRRAKVLSYCREIIRYMPIFGHPSAGIFRMQCGTVPVGAAIMGLAAFPQGEVPEERGKITAFLAQPSCAFMRQFLTCFLHKMEPWG